MKNSRDIIFKINQKIKSKNQSKFHLFNNIICTKNKTFLIILQVNVKHGGN